MPANRIGTHHDAKMGEQPSREFATRAVAHHRQDIGEEVAPTKPSGCGPLALFANFVHWRRRGITNWLSHALATSRWPAEAMGSFSSPRSAADALPYNSSGPNGMSCCGKLGGPIWLCAGAGSCSSRLGPAYHPWAPEARAARLEAAPLHHVAVTLCQIAPWLGCCCSYGSASSPSCAARQPDDLLRLVESFALAWLLISMSSRLVRNSAWLKPSRCSPSLSPR